ncbi:hypothetical protein HDV06_003569 [Boothiomyces sp. JEL0866]|nr:hypothetical protein HDV06_003569 [Boothiomyces sp. JEL0866]
MISFWDLERKKKKQERKSDEELKKEIALNIPLDPSIWTDVDFDLDYQMTKDKRIVNKSTSLPHILVNNFELNEDDSPRNTTANASPLYSSDLLSDAQAASAVGVNQDSNSYEKMEDDFTVDFSHDSGSEYIPSDNFPTKQYLSPIDKPTDPRYFQEWHTVDTHSLHITSIKDRLLKEILEFQFDNNIHIRRNNRRFLFLYDIKDARLFDSICYWKAANSNCTFMDALEEFVDYEHSDALVKVIFSNHYSPWDAMIKYKLKTKRQQLLEDIFRLLNKDLQREYRTVNAIRGKAITHILKTRLFVEFEKLEEDEDRRFLKILAPFEVLCHEAEKAGMRVNLSISYLKEIIQSKESKFKLNEMLPSAPNHYNRNLNLTEAQLDGIVLPLLNSVKESRSVPYIAKNIEFYKRGDGPKPNVKLLFFSSARRNEMVYNIILGCNINLQIFRKDDYSIEDLIEISIFESFYPVHDGPLYFESQDYQDNVSTVSSIKPLFRPGQSRADLYQKWKESFTWRKFVSYDPSTDIRRSILMLKFWKRKENLTSFRWDTYGPGKINSERVRPEWKPSVIGISPITGQKEYQTTFNERMTKKVITSVIMFGFLVLLAGLIAGLVAMQGFVREQLQLANAPKFFLQVKLSDFSTGIAGSIFTVMQIVLLKPVFTWITEKLNDFENHKTRTEYEDNLVLKGLIMGVLLNYASLSYLTMVKPAISLVYPNYEAFGKWPDSCTVIGIGESSKKFLLSTNSDTTSTPTQCLPLVFNSVFSIFIFRQIAIQMGEIIGPIFFYYWRQRDRMHILNPNTPEYISDGSLEKTNHATLTADYTSQVVMFGFVIMFSPFNPFAPLIAYIFNCFEIKIDVWKRLVMSQRPFARSAGSIGSWETAIKIIVHLGILTNAIIIAFASSTFDFYLRQLMMIIFPTLIESTTEKVLARLFFILVYENTVLMFATFINAVIPDVPAAVKIGIESEKYFERQNLRTKKTI